MSDFFSDFDSRVPAWLSGSGPAADIVLSTRARLARNLRAFRFPNHASDPELATILGDLQRRLVRTPAFDQGWFLETGSLDDIQRRSLKEMHLVSPALLRSPLHRGVLLSRDMCRTSLVNEEDHLRLQAYRSGFDPGGAVTDVLALDDQLEGEIDVAFSDELGYLTACPSNAGTGLRLSALVHLPGLVLAGEIEKVLNALRHLRFAVRGLFGEGSTVRGAVFQISNMVTLGRDEAEVTNDFSYHVGRVLIHEKTAREQLYQQDRLGLEDVVLRSSAVLAAARLITAQETFDRLSHVRLGVSLGILEGPEPAVLNRALVRQQTAHLELAAGRSLAGRDKSAVRADYLRRLLAAEDE